MKNISCGVQSIREFALANPIAFALSVLWLVTLFLVYLRDRSWNSIVQDLERALAVVEYDKTRLLDEMQLAADGTGGVNINDFCKVAFEILQKSTIDSVDAIIKEFPRYFGSAAILQVVCLISCILFEFNLLYSGLALKIGNKKVNSTLIVQTLNFLSKYHPITSILFGAFVIFKSFFAWIGLLSRDNFVEDMLRWHLSYFLAGILAYMINNLAGAMKYMPKDYNDWRESIQQSSWWMWFVGRALGIHNPNLAGVNILWLALKCFFAYAFRYFFYYRKQVCAFDERNHVFFINTFVHIWIVLSAAMIFYLPIIVLNLNKLQTENDQPWLVTMVRQRVLSLMQAINRALSKEQTLGLFTFFLMVVLAVYLFRFFYFLWTGKCTWYAWFVTWIFLHIHIGIVLLALPGLNFLMQRLKMHKSVRNSFLEKFVEGLLQVNKPEEGEKEDLKVEPEQQDDTEKATDASNVANSSMCNDEARRLGEAYYEETLLSAMLYGVFTDLSSFKEEREEQKKRDLAEGKVSSDDELEDQELYQVFNVILQSDLLAMEEEDEQQAANDAAKNESDTKESDSNSKDTAGKESSSEETAPQKNTTTNAESYLDHDKLD